MELHHVAVSKKYSKNTHRIAHFLFDFGWFYLIFKKIKKADKHSVYRLLVEFKLFPSGERGIRTPGGVTLNSFQDCRNRPLCHFSKISAYLPAKANIFLRRRVQI